MSAKTHVAGSIEVMVGAALTRVRLAVRIASEELDDNTAHLDTAAIFGELAQILDDTLEDLEPLAKLPYPISEYSGEPIDTWLADRAVCKGGAR